MERQFSENAVMQNSDVQKENSKFVGIAIDKEKNDTKNILTKDIEGKIGKGEKTNGTMP